MLASIPMCIMSWYFGKNIFVHIKITRSQFFFKSLDQKEAEKKRKYCRYKVKLVVNTIFINWYFHLISGNVYKKLRHHFV